MNNQASYLTDLQIKVLKGKNNLLDIITKASQKDVYIESINTIEEPDFTKYAVTVKTENVDQLNAFINELETLSFVREVGRKIN